MEISAILSKMTNVPLNNQTKQVKDSGFSNVLNQCLRTSEIESSKSDFNLQAELNKLGFGEIIVIIPETVSKKMKENPEYASYVIKKLTDWKSNNDTSDNALAATNGSKVSLYQSGKSYCLELDDNGEVKNYTVVSEGTEEQVRIKNVEYSSKQRDMENNQKTDKNIVKNLTATNSIMPQSDNELNPFNIGLLATNIHKLKINR